MQKLFREIDEILRGKKTSAEMLAKGTDHIRIGPLLFFILLFGAVYGLFMGLFSLVGKTPPCFEQMVSSAAKLPLVFLLSLVVTFPSLYVFSALRGVPMNPASILKIVLVPLACSLAVLASFGPITGFFTLSTESYPFMKLLNLLFFALAGFIGFRMLVRMLNRLETAGNKGEETVSPLPREGNAPLPPSKSGPGEPEMIFPLESKAYNTFALWGLLYTLVGAQMGWILRPFVGAPGAPFAWLIEREGNIFSDILKTLGDFMAGS